MKTLNLTDIDKSDVKYQIQEFPDGQQNIVIDTQSIDNNSWRNWSNEVQKGPWLIKSRLNNWLDLELIVCATKSLRNLGVKEIHLYVPYFMGARSDRQFEEGGNRYIKDVITPVINSLNFESVTCIDPHSYVLENCINNFQSISNQSLVENSLRLIAGDWKERTKSEGFILVSPDAGASHKIFKLAEQIGYKGDIITCSKERDSDGKIIGVEVPEFDISKDIIIIDDILDYGNTFNNIAGRMNDAEHKGKKYLIITHAIQDAGLENSLRWFDGIYTTNSYKSRESNERIKILNVF
jgi:ribose-phosphate pyrophosphokinase